MDHYRKYSTIARNFKCPTFYLWEDYVKQILNHAFNFKEVLPRNIVKEIKSIIPKTVY